MKNQATKKIGTHSIPTEYERKIRKAEQKGTMQAWCCAVICASLTAACWIGLVELLSQVG
jgi:hypothetical protein